MYMLVQHFPDPEQSCAFKLRGFLERDSEGAPTNKAVEYIRSSGLLRPFTEVHMVFYLIPVEPGFFELNEDFLKKNRLKTFCVYDNRPHAIED